MRYASSLSSTTAINGSRYIPSRNRPLYDALADVRKTASAQLNISRLQLAIQSLESEKPVIRVAFLGLKVSDTARQIVRLLLADALDAEDRWEKEILQKTAGDEQGLLIRFGPPPNSSLPQPRSTIPVLNVPAPSLESRNLELLITSVAGSDINEQSRFSMTGTSDTFLSPSILIPTSAGGRQTSISQPVHQSLIVVKGLDELLQVAQLLALTLFTSSEDRNAVRVAVDTEMTDSVSQSRTLMVNVKQAADGLAAIRRSVKEAITYEHKWVDSGMPALSQWLTDVAPVDNQVVLPPSVTALVSSLLSTAEANLQIQADQAVEARQSQQLSIAVQRNLESDIDTFSRNAHQELQSGLASAWSSRNWRKLLWYKLFWRVDDVGLIITDLVSNAWLPRTERAVYEISGRLAQVGISPVEIRPILQAGGQPVATAVESETATETTPILNTQFAAEIEPSVTPVVANPAGTAVVAMAPIPQPKPITTSISENRTTQIELAIADLTTIAQQLVFRTLSITGLSAALSGLTYVSLTPGSWYEAGTIVAVGTAYALWKMQGDWQKATRALENSLLLEGRNIIQRITQGMKRLVQKAGDAPQDDVELRSRIEAGNAVQKAREELEKLKKMS